jgi:Cu(I)/Ag(I) efflux system membrane fusion protein
MKKYDYVLILFVLVAASFLAGSWYNRPRTIENSVKMEPLTTDEDRAVTAEGSASSSLSPGTVTVSPEKQQLIGVRVAKVEKTGGMHTLHVLGRVVPDETRIYRINAATDGWVKKMLPVTTGSLVRKDELLATFYAPEFFSAMKAYLYGLRSLDRFQKSGTETKEQLELTDANIDNYRNALRNLGMSEHQLDEIMRTRQGADQVEIRAPEAGFLLTRNITLGERFQRGTELYRIADLSHVWVLADIFENESRHFRPGVVAKVSNPAQNRTFQARVSDVLPQFDATSRTLKVRLEADNPGYALRPDMFVDVEFPVRLPPALFVPVEAVLDSGTKKTVFVARGNGFFEPRRVETGHWLGDRVEITKGLKVGEQIVVSGNFLIDSESKMRLAAAGMQQKADREQAKDAEARKEGPTAAEGPSAR